MSDPSRRLHTGDVVLFASVFLVGLCTIVYELLIGTVSSYLQGDSITQFSLTIGLSMSAMGVGTYLSRLLREHLLYRFVVLEIALALVGATSVPLLFAMYTMGDLYYPFMITLIVVLGALIGLEIPLLTRIMAHRHELRANISNVLSLDYLGALLATLLFPFVLLPFVGLLLSGVIIGMCNLGVGWLNVWYFRSALSQSHRRSIIRFSTATSALLVLLAFGSERLLHGFDSLTFEHRVIISKQSPYQKLVVTRDRDDVRLFLNGHLQFSSIDEHRYHESLVHIPASLTPHIRSVLILGGGDGMAVRELLEYAEIESITLVDLDPAVTELARNNRLLVAMNEASLENPKVQLVHDDAWEFIEHDSGLYDLILADLPDPNSPALARLYSREFYRFVASRLSRTGVFTTQATSPFFAREAFWTIHHTLAAAGFEHVRPYHSYVPSMGDWGFIAASRQSLEIDPSSVPDSTRYLDDATLKQAFVFAKDLAPKHRDVSTINDPIVMRHYLAGWKHWN